MGSPPISVQRYGLTEAYAPTPASSALVDLVLVHGLNGDPHDTWTSKATNIFWPAQLLPQFVEEQRVRVLVYGYDADVTSFRGEGATKDKIHNHAERLIADLFANRRIRKATERPIIFLAHSLGGLVVKRALIASSEISGPKTEHLRSIFVSTYGILFLGTPHKGSDLGQWGSYLERLCRTVVLKKVVDTEPQLVDALKSNSETLQNIDRQFAQLMDDFHLYFFHEAKPTDLKGTYRFIVDEESAAPTLPDVERASIQADHSHMCKFDSDSAPGFDLVVDGIDRYSEQSVATIKARWVSEKEGRTAQKIRKAKELFPFSSDRINVQDPAASSTESSSEHTPSKLRALPAPEEHSNEELEFEREEEMDRIAA